MSKIALNLKDLNRSALERIIGQLVTADEDGEKRILKQLEDAASQGADAEKESNDLADLSEEKHGKPTPVSTEEGDQSPKKRKS
jgi:hypothetical protein